MTAAGGVGPGDAERLCKLVDAFEGVTVVVLADLVLDEFLHAEIARVSREAPVLIVEQRRLEAMPGGGANAARNIRALGATPLPVGVVGDDEAGRRLVERLREEAIEVEGIGIQPGYVTPVKTRLLAALAHSRPQQVIRIDRGEIRSVSEAAAGAAARRAEALVPRARAVLLSDYAYDAVRPELCAALVREARGRGLPVTSDSRHRAREFQGVSSATPNLEEAEEILGCRIDDDPGRLAEAGERLLAALDAREVLITRGSRGMVLFQRGEEPVGIPVFGSDQVSDVTGAGDTVIATFTLALAAGAAPRDAALAANAAAGLVVMKQGTATVTGAELKAALRAAGSPRGSG